MTATPAPVTVNRDIVVDVPVHRAFEVFTAGFGSWWPTDYRVGAGELAAVVLEPVEGGRVYERNTEGTECVWGQVLTWEPPHRLIVAWMLDARFQLVDDVRRASEYEVTFTAETPTRTRVSLEHRGFDRHGDDGDGVAAIVGGPGGWAHCLRCYADAESLVG